MKDHRTGYETSDVERVMDGEIDKFIEAFLSSKTPGEAGESKTPSEVEGPERTNRTKREGR